MKVTSSTQWADTETPGCGTGQVDKTGVEYLPVDLGKPSAPYCHVVHDYGNNRPSSATDRVGLEGYSNGSHSAVLLSRSNKGSPLKWSWRNITSRG